MPAWSEDPAYWRLVQALMHQGWYRAGRDLDAASGELGWRFHKGHILDARAEQLTWIAAEDEPSAMRILLGQLRRGELRQTA